MDEVKRILWMAKFQKKKNWLNIRKILLEGINKHPREPQLYNALGELYFNQKLFSRAIDVYLDLLEINQTDANIYFKIGNSFLSLQEYRLAIDYYEKIKFKFPELLYNKAYAYSKIGDYDKSLKIMQDIYHFPISSELPLIFISELYFAKKNYSHALKNLNKAEKMFGKQGTLYYLKGLAYSNMENWLKAYVEFEKADKLKVNNYHFYRAYGISCEKIGKTERAIYLLLKSIKEQPGNSVSYIDLIRIYLEHNRIVEAYTLVMHAKKNIPFSISLSLLYSQVMQRMKHYEKKND